MTGSHDETVKREFSKQAKSFGKAGPDPVSTDAREAAEDVGPWAAVTRTPPEAEMDPPVSRRFPAGYLSLPAAVDAIGRHRFGADWRPFCPLCLYRAAPAASGVVRARAAARYVVALAVAPLLVVPVPIIAGLAIGQDRYLTARMSFSVLAIACALILLAYGFAGIARQFGWFHGHPRPDGPTVERWRTALDEIEALVTERRVVVYALTLDGDLRPLAPDRVDRALLARIVRNHDRNAAWAAVRRHLGLRNAPSGDIVVDGAQVAAVCRG